MGRPSLLQAHAEKKAGEVVSTWNGGSCVMVSEGFIYLSEQSLFLLQLLSWRGFGL